jgi:DNA-binding NarL/FixJ family response regulator
VRRGCAYRFPRPANKSLPSGILRGYPAISQRLITFCRQTLVRGVPAQKSAGPLTSREAEVLQLIAEGKANKEIAGELGISIKTIEKHRQKLMNKLGIHDIAGLTRYAISKGTIETSAGAAKSL